MCNIIFLLLLKIRRDDSFVVIAHAEPSYVKPPVVIFAEGNSIARMVIVKQVEGHDVSRVYDSASP